MNLTQSFEGAFSRWRQLAPRERRMIVGGAIVLLLAFVWFVLFEPAWQGRQRLRDELPELRSQLARMASLSDEARALSDVRNEAMSAAAVRAELQRALTAAGLANQATLDAGTELIKVRFDAVRFDTALDWLAQVVRDARLRVADVSVVRDPQAGRVTATFGLERPAASGR
ncbi:MAG: type II secretion system protein M [Burkholderiaceae bacterium]